MLGVSSGSAGFEQAWSSFKVARNREVTSAASERYDRSYLYELAGLGNFGAAFAIAIVQKLSFDARGMLKRLNSETHAHVADR